MSVCHHPGRELVRREDGAHCPSCDVLIYPASACVTVPPPAVKVVPEPGPAPAAEAGQ
ncbi:hypothetical protein [Streptomyces marincola]|uniref:hypothetical protein n=1 Tax=Streptomyces marincola TaxID=2878388 RepID=UPI00131C9EDC|nr:hypothetical protein [Streptomyces marincola]